MKKFISLSLALILAVLSLLSCSDKGNAESETDTVESAQLSASNTESESETEAEKTVTDTVREKYSSYSYDGYEYKVLAPGPNAHFAYNEVGTDVNEVWVEESDELRSTTQYSRAISQRKTCSESKSLPFLPTTMRSSATKSKPRSLREQLSMTQF